VCTRYDLHYSNPIGKAHEIYNIMQKASSFFRVLDVTKENYTLFVNSIHDMHAMENLYRNIYESSILIPSSSRR
jgi:hypothetical protein